MTSNIESNIAYYYTFYTFVCLIGKIRIFYVITTFSNIYFDHLWLMFKKVSQ